MEAEGGEQHADIEEGAGHARHLHTPQQAQSGAGGVGKGLVFSAGGEGFKVGTQGVGLLKLPGYTAT